MNPLATIASMLSMWTSSMSGLSLQARTGQLGVRDIGPIALNVGVGIIIVGLVTLILSGFGDTVNGTANPDTQSVIDTGIDSMLNFSTWFDIITTVAAAAIILGLILGFAGFVMGRRRRSGV